MEHSNPLLRGKRAGQKFITFGELMLRLTPPNYEKIRMATNFEARLDFLKNNFLSSRPIDSF